MTAETTTDSFRIIAPTGCLGYGFSEDDFRRCMRDFRPDVVGVDAGSTDPGPYYLGAGVSFTSRQAVQHEMEVLLSETVAAGIPLVVGNAGGAGGRPHTAWMEEIVRDLATRHGWEITVAVIDSEVSTARLHEVLDAGKVVTFESGDELTHDEVDRAVRVVAQLGPEPLAEALVAGADVVLAGRTCDDAIFAAYPLSRGGGRGPATYAGKVLECGALACEPIGMDVLTAEVFDDRVRFEPGSLERRSTVASVTGHSLYEREDPFVQVGPGGEVHLNRVEILQDGDRAVVVRGIDFIPRPYTLKLEGVRRVGHRAVSIAGVTDPGMIARLDDIIAEAKRRAERHLASAGVRVVHLDVRAYGLGGATVPGLRRPDIRADEVGLIMEAVAETADEALAACHELSGTLLHIDFPGQFNTAGNLAFPYSPSEFDGGEAFEFNIYHLIETDRPEDYAVTRMIRMGAEHG